MNWSKRPTSEVSVTLRAMSRMIEAKSGSGRAGLRSAGRGLATGFCAPDTDGACLLSSGAVVWNVGWTVSNASMPAVYDCANGLGFAGLLRFSEPDPLRADAVESLLGAKLNDGVFAGLGGGESDALNVASEVVVGAWGKKLGAVFDCFVPSSGFANANGANEVLGALTTSGSGVFGAAKENAGSADVLFGGAGGEVNVGKSDF
jgi:hypothetical protein